MNDFVETRIIDAVRKLLTGRVNDLLGETEHQIPLIEFSDYEGKSAVVPVIGFSGCEQSEKERLIRLEAYSLTIIFSLPDVRESEMFCYAYSGAVGKAFFDDTTLGGVVDNAVVTGKRYVPPKNASYGDGWELIVSLRVTVEQ